MNRGYVRVWRKIEDSGIIGNADLCQMLMYIMLKATHKERKVAVGTKIVTLKPGEFFTGRKQLATALESTEQRVRTCLKSLEKCEIINQQPTSYGSIISLINWDKYQCDQPAINQNFNQQSTSNQPAINQQSTTKQECKNLNTEEGKKEEDYSPEPFRDSEPLPSQKQQNLSPVVLTIPTKGKAAGDYEVTKADIAEWQEAYPGVDVPQALRSIRQWNIAHPDRQKTKRGVRAHITGWLEKEQNRSRGFSAAHTAQHGSPIMSEKTVRTMSNLEGWVQQ